MGSKWQVVPVGSFCKIVSGSTPKTTESSYWGGGVGWVTPMDLSKISGKYITSGSRNITEVGLTNCSAELIPTGSLVMSSRAPIGYFAINKSPVATNQGCKSFVCNDSVDIEFLYYALNQYIDSIKRLGSGSTFAEVGKKQLDSLSIKVPTKNVQQKIADILSSVDEVIQKTDQIIQKTEELKKGLMDELLTKGIGHKKFKNTKLGEIPIEWQVKQCYEIAREIIDCKNRTPKYFSDGEYLVVRTPNVRNGNLTLKNVLYTNKNNYIEWTKRGAPRAGDVLITREAPAGEVCLVPNKPKLCLGQRMMYIRPNKSVLDKYLLYYLQSNILQKHLKVRSTGSTVTHLKVGQIKEMPIILPSLVEQKRISKSLRSIDSEISIEKENKKTLLVLKNGLMQDIFSQKVEVS